jgi:hypothetical protein
MHAELLHHREVRGDVGMAGVAAGGIACQPLGHGGDRIERLGGERACRRGAQVRRTEADTEGLGARLVTQEAQYGEQLRRVALGNPDRARRLIAQESAALAPVVVDLEVSGALGAHLEHVPLPERLELGGVGARRAAQRRVILRDDRQRRGERQPHQCRSFGGSMPSRFEPMN